jgi:hypothetical protein
MATSRQRQIAREIQERFDANAALRDEVLADGGRSTSVVLASHRPITRRASSANSDTSFGFQSSTEDLLEASAAGVEDTSSSNDAEAGISSANVGAGFSSADVDYIFSSDEVGAEISSANVGAGSLRPATAITGNSSSSSTATQPILNAIVPVKRSKTELTMLANVRLRYTNTQAKIDLAAKLLSQQAQINFDASDITNLGLSEADLIIALERFLEAPIESVPSNTQTSSVNVVSTAKPPSLHGVITERDVHALQSYSSALGAANLDLRHIVDKAARVTIQTNLEARGHQFGLQATDYERWIDWDHRRFTEVLTILFGGKNVTETNVTLRKALSVFNFGFQDPLRLGNLTHVVYEQQVLDELYQLIENDTEPSNKTVAGLQELVNIIHANIGPKNPIMMHMKATQSMATTPKEFLVKFLIARGDNRTSFYSAKQWGNVAKHLNDTANTSTSSDFSKNKKQKKDKEYRDKSPVPKSLVSTDNAEICWSCGVIGHNRTSCFKEREPKHKDRNQEQVPFSQSSIGKQWKLKFPERPYCHNDKYLDGSSRIVPQGKSNNIISSFDRFNYSYSTLQHDGYLSSIHNSSHSDFLSVIISPLQKVQHLAEEVEAVERAEEAEEGDQIEEGEEELQTNHNILGSEVSALLDTGCLVGDCISQEIVDTLNVSNLLYRVKTTICSGFNNHCDNDFQCLKLKITFKNEKTFFLQTFNTIVIVLKNSPIDIIIGRETIKKNIIL